MTEKKNQKKKKTEKKKTEQKSWLHKITSYYVYSTKVLGYFFP